MLITPEMLAPSKVHIEDDERRDFERGMSYVPRLTLLLIGAYVAVYAWEVASGALASTEAIVEAGALSRPHVQAGEIWRLLTATFLHGGADHLIGNGIVLYIVGMACEHAFTLRRAATIYLASALAGSLASLAASPGPSVGASGLVFGVMGAVVVFFYKYQGVLELRDKRVGLVLLVWAVYTVVTGFFSPWIDNFAHIGGFVGGAATGAVLRPALLDRSVAS